MKKLFINENLTKTKKHLLWRIKQDATEKNYNDLKNENN